MYDYQLNHVHLNLDYYANTLRQDHGHYRHRHLLRNKSVKQRRRAGSSKLVAPGQRANLIRGLPFA